VRFFATLRMAQKEECALRMTGKKGFRMKSRLTDIFEYAREVGKSAYCSGL
jgi:hypothetical protein